MTNLGSEEALLIEKAARFLPEGPWATSPLTLTIPSSSREAVAPASGTSAATNT